MKERPPRTAAMYETEEELQLIKDSFLLPFMMTIVESSKEKIRYEINPLSDLYISLAEMLLNRLHEQLVRVKRTLREKQIKVIEDGRSGSALRYRYICRGYEHRFDILNSVAKSEISIKLGKEVQGLINQIIEGGNRNGKRTEATNKR